MIEALPPISLIRDFSNQNACGNVSKISVNHTDDIPYVETFHFTASEIQSNMELTSRRLNHSLNLRWRVGYLFVHGFRMLLDFFMWDMKKVRNINRNRHAVAGRQLPFHLFSGFSECMWLISLKTLRRFGRHISFVWFDLNLLQQVSVAAVQISDHTVSWSTFHLQYFEFVIVARKYFLSRP